MMKNNPKKKVEIIRIHPKRLLLKIDALFSYYFTLGWIGSRSKILFCFPWFVHIFFAFNFYIMQFFSCTIFQGGVIFQYPLNERRESVYGKSAGPLPPPPEVINYDNAVTNQILENAKAEKHSSSSESVCPICLTNPKDMAFACGHTTLALCV
ncbi:uncharacterized protein LOC116402606 isoform X1 [Cucumis sativus]|uniref:uncharacterized protein LOC116402606 isoform X1 n=1 Tax=Cucumis sativus TaxID=3659 RepID=UPI0012F4A452|nr:uncharacterized protein LOC116402606 isoform X1 [Cucumis sativus]